MRSMLRWVKRLVGGSQPSGVFKLGYGSPVASSRNGRLPFDDAILRTLASVGARPGDIVEVDAFGAARVVGCRPHLANEQQDVSEQAIRAALKMIHGDDAASPAYVTAGSNLVVFHTHKHT